MTRHPFGARILIERMLASHDSARSGHSPKQYGLFITFKSVIHKFVIIYFSGILQNFRELNYVYIRISEMLRRRTVAQNMLLVLHGATKT